MHLAKGSLPLSLSLATEGTERDRERERERERGELRTRETTTTRRGSDKRYQNSTLNSSLLFCVKESEDEVSSLQNPKEDAIFVAHLWWSLNARHGSRDLI